MFPKTRTRSIGTGTSGDMVSGGEETFGGHKRSRKGGSRSTAGFQRKHLSYFSDDDDPIARERRKSRVREEIARRKEKLASLGDLTDLKHYYDSSMGGLAGRLVASDYSSHVPHYGSLPRVDFPASSREFPQLETGFLTAPTPGNSYLEQQQQQLKQPRRYQPPSMDHFDSRQFHSLPRNLDQYWHFDGGSRVPVYPPIPGPTPQLQPAAPPQYPTMSFCSTNPGIPDRYSNAALPIAGHPYNKLHPMYHSSGANLDAPYVREFPIEYRTPRPINMGSSGINYNMDRYSSDRIIQPSYQSQTLHHRSLPFLNELERSGYYSSGSYSQNNPLTRSTENWYPAGRSASVSYPRRPVSSGGGRTGGGEGSSLISHYANYLNSEFHRQPSAINDYSYASATSPYNSHTSQQHHLGDFSTSYSATVGKPAGMTTRDNREWARRSWPMDDSRGYPFSTSSSATRQHHAPSASAIDYSMNSSGNTLRMAADGSYYYNNTSRASASLPDSSFPSERRYYPYTSSGTNYSAYPEYRFSGATGPNYMGEDVRNAYSTASGLWLDPAYSSYDQSYSRSRYGYPTAELYHPRSGLGYRTENYGLHQNYSGFGGLHQYNPAPAFSGRLYDSGYSSGGYLSDGYSSYPARYSRPYYGPTDISDLYTGPMSKSKSGEFRSRTLPQPSAGQLNFQAQRTGFGGSMHSGLNRSFGDWDRRGPGRDRDRDVRSRGSLGRENRTRSTYYTDNSSEIKRILLTRDPKDRSVKGNGLGMKVVGGKVLPDTDGELGCYVAAVYKGGLVETLGEVKEGDQILEWNGIGLTGKTYEEVQRIVNQSSGEIEIVIRSNANLNRVYELKQSVSADKGYESAPDTSFGYLSDRQNANTSNRSGGNYLQQSTPGPSYSGYGAPPPPVPAHQYLEGKASPSFSTTPRTVSPVSGQICGDTLINCGYLNVAISFDVATGTLFATVISARDLRTRCGGERSGYPSPFVKIYLLPGRRVENKRRTKYIPNTCNPDWNQTVVYKDLNLVDLSVHLLEFTVWDYDKFKQNDFLGQAVIGLGDRSIVTGQPMWYPLVCHNSDFMSSDRSEIIEHSMRADGFRPELPHSSSMESRNYLDGDACMSASTSFHYLSMPRYGPGQLWYQSKKWKLSPISEAPFAELYAGDLLLMLKAVQPRMAQSISAPQSFEHSASQSLIIKHEALRTKVVCSALQTRNLRLELEKRVASAIFVKLQLIVEGRRVAKLQTRPFKTRVLPPCNCSVSYTMDGDLHKTTSVLRASVWEMTGLFRKPKLMGELFVDLRAANLETRAVIAWYTLFRPTP